jgi:hypothetical protein
VPSAEPSDFNVVSVEAWFARRAQKQFDFSYPPDLAGRIDQVNTVTKNPRKPGRDAQRSRPCPQ